MDAARKDNILINMVCHILLAGVNTNERIEDWIAIIVIVLVIGISSAIGALGFFLNYKVGLSLRTAVKDICSEMGMTGSMLLKKILFVATVVLMSNALLVPIAYLITEKQHMYSITPYLIGFSLWPMVFAFVMLVRKLAEALQ